MIRIRVMFRKISRSILGGRRAEIRDVRRPTGMGVEFDPGISTDDATLLTASMMSLAASLTGDPALGGFANGLMNSWAAKRGADLGAVMAGKRAAAQCQCQCGHIRAHHANQFPEIDGTDPADTTHCQVSPCTCKRFEGGALPAETAEPKKDRG